MDEMEQEKRLSLNADKSLRRALDIQKAKDLLKKEGFCVAKKLIIDGVDIIDIFYNKIGDYDRMCVNQSSQEDEDCNWETVVEFGYKSIIVNFLGYETFPIEYESVKAVRITKWDEHLRKDLYTIYRK